jgi:Kinesin motor domain
LKYDLVADPYSNQEEIFRSVGMPGYIKRLFEGYSSTVFCYGPTGSGKTFTMQGETGGSGVLVFYSRKTMTTIQRQTGV